MKTQQTIDEYAELNSAIRLAAKDAGPRTTSREAAQALLESSRELIDRFASFLLIEEAGWPHSPGASEAQAAADSKAAGTQSSTVAGDLGRGCAGEVR